MVNIVKDYSRTIDFIEHFQEATGRQNVFDLHRLAFCGFRWGGCVGPVWLVADYLTHSETWRVKAAVMTDATLVQCLQPLELDQLNYLPHLRVPSMLLNCRRLVRAPFDRAQQPMYDLIPMEPGTGKVLISFPQHTWGIPAADFDAHANRWLDEKLGADE
jgi:dienelactone hydrolase